MNIVKTSYGHLTVSFPLETYPDGTIQACTPVAECVLETGYGALTPQYTTDELRKKEVLPVTFYPSGVLKSLPLETRTVISTPAGDVAAELVSFHPDGTISRVFPLNGKLSGYWSQEDEGTLVEPVTLDTPLGQVKAKAISVGFYETGTLRSLTLWPGERLTVSTPLGDMETRIGVSFAPDGRVRSLEPAEPIMVQTPLGRAQAFDPDAIGVNGDVNSLAFDDQGRVIRFTTTLTRLVATDGQGKKTAFTPQHRVSYCGDAEQEIIPMMVRWSEEAVSVRLDPDKKPTVLPAAEYRFATEPYLPQLDNLFTGLRCSV